MRRKVYGMLFVAALCGLRFSADARASVVSVPLDSFYQEVVTGGSNGTTAVSPDGYTGTTGGTYSESAPGTIDIGVSGATGDFHQNAGLFIFELPTLPAGDVVGSNTTFSITAGAYSSSGSSTEHGDLWGVGNFPTVDYPGIDSSTSGGTSASAPNPGTFFSDSGNNSDDPNPTSTDTMIVNDFLTKSSVGTSGGTLTTPTGSSNALQTYLQEFYTANPNYNASTSPNYVYLRINIDDDQMTSTTNRFTVTASSAALSLDEEPSATPEPASLGLLSLGALALLRRRK